MFTAGQEAVLLERPDAADLAAAIRRFIEDPSSFRRMASAARRRVERDFSVEAKAERLLACYRQVVTGRPLGELPDAAGAASGNGSR
jgi:glycosyltransferase involved in cell wall biosynthesis